MFVRGVTLRLLQYRRHLFSFCTEQEELQTPNYHVILTTVFIIAQLIFVVQNPMEAGIVRFWIPCFTKLEQVSPLVWYRNQVIPIASGRLYTYSLISYLGYKELLTELW